MWGLDLENQEWRVTHISWRLSQVLIGSSQDWPRDAEHSVAGLGH